MGWCCCEWPDTVPRRDVSCQAMHAYLALPQWMWRLRNLALRINHSCTASAAMSRPNATVARKTSPCTRLSSFDATLWEPRVCSLMLRIAKDGRDTIYNRIETQTSLRPKLSATFKERMKPCTFPQLRCVCDIVGVQKLRAQQLHLKGISLPSACVLGYTYYTQCV